MNIKETLCNYAEKIERALEEKIPLNHCLQGEICDVVSYSLLDAGKRIRPVLALEFCRVCGGDMDNALPFACAVEMIHSYSLIHDDLPCLDNDDIRRGKPSAHIKFGEAMALLAGDGLQTLAFETALNPAEFSGIPAERVLAAAYELAHASGINGMVGGQVIDICSEGKTISLETLRAMDAGKTGAIIVAAAKMGCIIAGAGRKQIEAAEIFAHHIGIAFQIVDDILDKTGDEQTLGKRVGSDENSAKSTYVSLLGLEEAKKQALFHTEQAKQALSVFGAEAEFLSGLADYLCNRNY